MRDCRLATSGGSEATPARNMHMLLYIIYLFIYNLGHNLNAVVFLSDHVLLRHEELNCFEVFWVVLEIGMFCVDSSNLNLMLVIMTVLSNGRHYSKIKQLRPRDELFNIVLINISPTLN